MPIRLARLVLLASVLSPIPLAAQSTPLTVASPDHALEMTFAIQPPDKTTSATTGKLVYSAAFHGKPFLDASGLALELNDEPALGSAVQIVDTTPGSGIDDYTLTNSKVSKVHEAYNSLVLRVSEPSGSHRAMSIEARAYNSG